MTNNAEDMNDFVKSVQAALSAHRARGGSLNDALMRVGMTHAMHMDLDPQAKDMAAEVLKTLEKPTP